MRTILINQVETTIYGFDFASYTSTFGTPNSLIGRNICALTAAEKQNMLIKKLLEHIRLPSKKELLEMQKNLAVYVLGGVPHLFEKNSIGEEIKTHNLGTIQTPAFFYDKFIFLLNRRKKVFEPQDINVVFFNNDYALLMIGENLLIKFDVKGLRCVGNFVSVTKVPRGYVIVAKNANNDETVYAAHKTFQTLFETSIFSSFKTDPDSGMVFHEYTDMSTIPAGQAIDTYVSKAGGYILANHDVE